VNGSEKWLSKKERRATMNYGVSGDEGYAALIGIDWADQKHDMFILDTKTRERKHVVVDNKPEDLSEWVAELQARFEGGAVAVCVEQAKGGLIHHLMLYGFITIYPINPHAFSEYRKSMRVSGAKDDPSDAALLLDYLEKHRDRLRAWEPEDEKNRLLGMLVKDRRKAVDETTDLTNRLRAALKGYFPQALEWAGKELHSPMACDFLLKWPTLSAVQKAKPQALRKFYYGHKSRDRHLIEERIEQVKKAKPLTTDRAVIDASVMVVTTVVNQLRILIGAVEKYDRLIKGIFSKHEDREIFESLPGAGDRLAPRLLHGMGTDRGRYETSDNVQCMKGIAPVTERSGKTTFVHWRWACDKFTRQSFHEFANCSRHFCKWAAAFYQLQRDRGKGHHAAVRSLAFKWIRIIYRCWLDRVPYDDAIYVEALKNRGSDLYHLIDQTALAK
jgi:transposase